MENGEKIELWLWNTPQRIWFDVVTCLGKYVDDEKALYKSPKITFFFPSPNSSIKTLKNLFFTPQTPCIDLIPFQLIQSIKLMGTGS